MRQFTVVAVIMLSLCLCRQVMADAGSGVRFAMPERFGEYQALAYDDDNRPIGVASLSMRKAADDAVEVAVKVRLDAGSHAEMQAWLVPDASGQHLRLRTQSTRAYDDQDQLVVDMQADHERGTAQCTYRGYGTRSVRLPPGERIVNVPLNLLLRPVVAGEMPRVAFQTLLCDEAIRIVEAEVRYVRAIPVTSGNSSLVEARYRLDLGPLLTLALAPFLQRISFWFEANRPYLWVGHRMPLYAKGPAVLVLRQGYRPQDL